MGVAQGNGLRYLKSPPPLIFEKFSSPIAMQIFPSPQQPFKLRVVTIDILHQGNTAAQVRNQIDDLFQRYPRGDD